MNEAVQKNLTQELSVALTEHGGDLIDLYRDSMRQEMERVPMLLKDGQWSEITMLAHRLGGSSAVLGISEMLGIFRQLELSSTQNSLEGSQEITGEILQRVKYLQSLPPAKFH